MTQKVVANMDEPIFDIFTWLMCKKQTESAAAPIEEAISNLKVNTLVIPKNSSITAVLPSGQQGILVFAGRDADTLEIVVWNTTIGNVLTHKAVVSASKITLSKINNELTITNGSSTYGVTLNCITFGNGVPEVST